MSELPFNIRRLGNQDRLPINPSQEYQAILAGDPRMLNWYTIHSRLLPILSTKPDYRAMPNVRCKNYLLYFLHENLHYFGSSKSKKF